MDSALSRGAQLAASAARVGWFWGLNQLVDRSARALGPVARYRPRRPVPSRQELMVGLAELMLADAEAVGRGLAPPVEGGGETLAEHLARVRAMLDDLPAALRRRASGDVASVRSLDGASDKPAYYAQDFHFQSGGYLSEQSARIYDVQVETLFYGAADGMRRAALPVIAREIAGRDQRKLGLLDVACGTGRLLRAVRLGFPALKLTGLDLSSAYLEEARRHMGTLRPAHLIEGNAEHVPLPDASQDIVTCVFLFHELPPEVRRTVAAEMARVLRPGGVLVLIDSLQMGDRPGWDGLLEGFPVRFHEPYFRHYTIDDLDGLLGAVGLEAEGERLAFLSKVMVRRKRA